MRSLKQNKRPHWPPLRPLQMRSLKQTLDVARAAHLLAQRTSGIAPAAPTGLGATEPVATGPVAMGLVATGMAAPHRARPAGPAVTPRACRRAADQLLDQLLDQPLD